MKIKKPAKIFKAKAKIEPQKDESPVVQPTKQSTKKKFVEQPAEDKSAEE